MTKPLLKNRINIICFSLLIVIPSITFSQGKPIIKVAQDTLRIESDSKKDISRDIKIIVPKDKDSSDKDKIADQASLKDAKIIIEFDGENSNVDANTVKVAYKSEFKITDITKQQEFLYPVSVTRNEKDDRSMIFKIKVIASKGDEIKELSKRVVVYIKPLIKDTLASNRIHEFWIFTGTNFDPFSGPKSLEFFFRINSLIRVNEKFLIQFAFYKNRYNSSDTSGILPFTKIQRPLLGDSTYTLTRGNFKRTVNQTADPVGKQLDLLYKLSNNKESNFYGSFDFDLSTTNVSLNYKNEFFDSVSFRTAKLETVENYDKYGTTYFPESFSYRKPSYNIGIGLMWILNDEISNAKLQVIAGLSKYAELLSRVKNPDGNYIYTSQSLKMRFGQIRVFYTYKPVGISLGVDGFFRAGEPGAFALTLSKVFDFKSFGKTFSPVSALKVNSE